MALWSVTILAAVAGARLGRYLPPRIVKWASVVLFAAVGVVVIVSTPHLRVTVTEQEC